MSLTNHDNLYVFSATRLVMYFNHLEVFLYVEHTISISHQLTNIPHGREGYIIATDIFGPLCVFK
jgi:hypothetical protein